MIPYGRQHIENDEIRAVIDVLKSDFLTTGPTVEAFEEKVARYCDARYGIAVSSGTAALHVAALALGLQSGEAGITSPNTFLASANCMALCNATPRFADIELKTYCISPIEIKKKLTSNTRLLIPVHFAGQPCDMESIWRLAEEEHLYVIEDAAHALGSSWRDDNGNWHKVGSCSHSHITTFSFHPVKTITTGEGGMILTNNGRLANRCRLIRNHGIERDPVNFQGVDIKTSLTGNGSYPPWYYEMQELGFNYRLSDVQSALGLVQMRRLGEFVEKRRDIWQRYNDGLSSIDGLVTPVERDGVCSAWHLYTVRTKYRNELLYDLREKGIGAHAMYIPVHLQPWYRKRFGYQTGDFPAAERYFNTCLVLPLYPDLENDVQNYIIRCIKSFFKRIN